MRKRETSINNNKQQHDRILKSCENECEMVIYYFHCMLCNNSQHVFHFMQTINGARSVIIAKYWKTECCFANIYCNKKIKIFSTSLLLSWKTVYQFKHFLLVKPHEIKMKFQLQRTKWTEALKLVPSRLCQNPSEEAR